MLWLDLSDWFDRQNGREKWILRKCMLSCRAEDYLFLTGRSELLSRSRMFRRIWDSWFLSSLTQIAHAETLHPIPSTLETWHSYISPAGVEFNLPWSCYSNKGMLCLILSFSASSKLEEVRNSLYPVKLLLAVTLFFILVIHNLQSYVFSSSALMGPSSSYPLHSPYNFYFPCTCRTSELLHPPVNFLPLAFHSSYSLIKV